MVMCGQPPRIPNRVKFVDSGQDPLFSTVGPFLTLPLMEEASQAPPLADNSLLAPATYLHAIRVMVADGAHRGRVARLWLSGATGYGLSPFADERRLMSVVEAKRCKAHLSAVFGAVAIVKVKHQG